MSEPSKYPQKQIDRFTDIFHEQGDDIDEEKDENIDFDNLYQSFLLTTDEPEIPVNEIVDDDDRDNPIIDLLSEEEEEEKEEQKTATGEHHESEQSSTTKKRPSVTPTTPSRSESTTKKKMRTTTTAAEAATEVDEEAEANLPRFLSQTNPVFEQTMYPLLVKMTNSINIEHLRKVALLKFKSAVNDLNISLWDTYLRSGTGKLEIPEDKQQQRQQAATATTSASTSDSNLFLWPTIVKTKMIESGYTTTTNINEIDHDSCVNYVCKIIREFREKNTHYYSQLKERKQRLGNSLTLEMEEAIDKFVEQYGTTFHRVPIDGLISSVKYRYKDQLLQSEFQLQNPREYQSEVFENLCKVKDNKETAKLELAILKQRIVHNHLPSSFESLHIPQPISLANIQNGLVRQRLSERYHKVLQRTKSDMMHVYVATQEAQMEEYRQKFDQDWSEMKENLRCGPTHKKLTPTMIDILKRRFRNIDNHLLYLDGQELNMSRRSDTKKSNIGCSPTLVQNTIHYLSSEQIVLLNRGPTYIPPCQMHILSSSSSSSSSTSVSLDQILNKQMAPLRRQLTRVFTRYPVDLSRRMKFEQEIQTLFKSSFSLTIPSSLEKRACYEKQLIQSTRRQLRHDRLILRRTADDQNTYYLGSLDDFNFKANEYIQNSNCYERIGMIDNTNNTEQQQQQQLDEIIRSIDLNLELLQERKLISKEHVSKLNVNSRRTTIKLPHLYFLPETNQDGSFVSLQPRISSCDHCPIQILATYLDQILRPLFEQISQSTMFVNGADFMRRLEYYCIQQDSLQPETRFITFEIQNLYTHLLHTDLLLGVNRLLVNPINQGRRPDRLTSDSLEELTSIFLRNNIFTYNGYIYRYIKGIPLNFPLSRLLFNIYLHDWQYTLLRPIRVANEFFGLYHNTGFFTWNQSIDQIKTILNEINQSFLHTNIQLRTISISTQGNFLNVYIKHRLGLLYTRVYHDPTQQSFLLPYVTGHPRLLHRQWFRFALIRAALYCMHMDDFKDEQLYIELTFLANGYSLDFVEYHIRQFFRLVRPQELDVQLDRYGYKAIRTYCFRLIDQQKRDYGQQQLEVNRQFIQIPYLFDWGTRWKFNREFYKLWSDILEQDSTFRKHGLKIKLHSKHCYLLNVLLTH